MLDYHKWINKFDVIRVGAIVKFSDEPNAMHYTVIRKFSEKIPGIDVKETFLALKPNNGEDFTRNVGHMDRDADYLTITEDSSAFDMMLAGCSIENKMVFTIHVNQYAVQNVKELPGIREVGNLGAIMFTGIGTGTNRDRWYVDIDPSWLRFADEVIETIERRKVQIVFFYWP